MQQITKSETALTKKNILNRISDVPGGVSIQTSNLIAGNVVEEAFAVTPPTSGVRKIAKAIQILTGSTTTVFKVNKATNHFKVGDIICQSAGTAAYAITTSVDNGDGTVSLTVGTALPSATAGTWIYESTGIAGARTGAIVVVDSIIKSGFTVPTTTQVILIKDVFVRADVVGGCIAPLYLSQLKGILEIKY